MSKTTPWKKALIYGSAILLGIVFGPVAARLAGGLQVVARQPAVAQAADVVQVAVPSPSSPEAAYVCTPQSIATFQNRIHVLCTVAAPGGIWYFAAPTSDSKNAARILSLMLTAQALGKNLAIYYDPAVSGASYGCLYANCRQIDSIATN